MSWCTFIAWVLSLVLFGFQAPEEEENPFLFQHVNIISGHLDLSFKDIVVEGGIQLPILRQYTSAGAQERDGSDSDLYLKRIKKGFLIQGGWSFFSHTHLLIRPGLFTEEYVAYIADVSGSITPYKFVKKEGKHTVILAPKSSPSKGFGKISGKYNKNSSYLALNEKEGKAVLFHADGTKGFYSGNDFRGRKNEGAHQTTYYRLNEEQTPSHHWLIYQYDSKHRIQEVKLTNPQKTKTFSWIRFDLEKTTTPYRFQITTSDARKIDYQFQAIFDRDYLQYVSSPHFPNQQFEYVADRKGAGARINGIRFADETQYRVYYYVPDKKEEKAIKKDPKKKKFQTDKVQRIEAPLGTQGELIPIARFIYHPGVTEVIDAEGLLTKYFYQESLPYLIEYYDQKQELSSSTKFIWCDGKLKSKIKLYPSGKASFSKLFDYDSLGNVTKETFFGNLTGSCSGPFVMQKDGSLDGAESFTKTFVYDLKLNLLLKEEEESGRCIEYTYKENTNLLLQKLTFDNHGLYQRELFFYDEDHLLCGEIVDDGFSKDPSDLSNVTQRFIKRRELDPNSGLPICIRELYLDLNSMEECLIKKTLYSYSTTLKVTEEQIFDANDQYCYTLYFDYDDYGNLIKKTTPEQRVNSYQFDTLGRLIECKEVGKSKKHIKYTPSGKISEEYEMDSQDQARITNYTYDIKGRLISKTDYLNQSTKQIYDSFGHCVQTQLPATWDEHGELFILKVDFSYDMDGNLIRYQNPLGQAHHTAYTSFRKPYLIIQPDGSCTKHTYSKYNTLERTDHPDKSYTTFCYDGWYRMTQKSTFSSCHELLSEEYWDYDSFHLLKYVDTYGLATKYTYDGAGRLIEESTDNRSLFYEYDPLGNLEKKHINSSSFIEYHNFEGMVIESYEQESDGQKENHTSFTYDEEGRKSSIQKSTSSGLATDLFFYDDLGRLCKHIDPFGFITSISFKDNCLLRDGIYITEKTTVDPLQQIRIDTFDAQKRKLSTSIMDAEHKICSKEEFFYDQAGNKKRQITTIFSEGKYNSQHVIQWSYDQCGRIICESEQNKKNTFFEYDLMGRVIKKTLPDHVYFTFSYDALGRILEEQSSDQTIHYQYLYERGTEPSQIIDLISGHHLERSFDLYRNLIHEVNNGLEYSWEYDNQGRCVQFTLPDKSFISYNYSDLHMRSCSRHTLSGHSYTHSYEEFDKNGHVQKESLIHRLGCIESHRDLLERLIGVNSSWHTISAGYNSNHLMIFENNSLFKDTSYIYDPLNQLKKAGDTSYSFDSLGNPCGENLSDTNELLTHNGIYFDYDLCGRCIKKASANFTILYSYDALGRLIAIEKLGSPKIYFSYDPLSRLHTKSNNGDLTTYLYDKEWEIGTLNPQGDIQELKILGLGIHGDIGSAVIIEKGSDLYAPLHDLKGNLIALVDLDGNLLEAISVDAFGQNLALLEEKLICPWRFQSKRLEEDLILFPLRFYDPSIYRWITPDPSGYQDGPNVYRFVANSPINRLDLFGLYAEPLYSTAPIQAEIPIHLISSYIPKFDQVHTLRGNINGVEVDWIIQGGNWSKLTFNEEEIQNGKINIFDHFHELMPSEGRSLGLISFQNGIQTTLREAKDMVNQIAKINSDDTLILSLYCPTKGLIPDVTQALTERFNTKDTQMTALTRQYFQAISTSLFKINPELLWLHIAHSRGGGIATRAVEGMSAEQQQILKQNFIFLGIGPSLIMPKKYTYEAKNIVSSKDLISKMVSLKFLYPSDELIKTVESSLPYKMPFMKTFTIDHAFMGTTYQMSLSEELQNFKSGFFYSPSR